METNLFRGSFMKFNVVDRKAKEIDFKGYGITTKVLSILGSFLKNLFVDGNAIQEDSIDGKAMGNNFADEQSSRTDCFQKNG